MRSFRLNGHCPICLAVLLAVSLVACGDDAPPAGPSPAPGTATLVIENFTASSTPGSAGFNYRASLRLRETGGAAATITGLTLTVTQTSGVTISQDVAPTQAFPETTVAANGTLDSNTLSVTGAPIQATQLVVRITYTGASGGSRTVEEMTTVTAGT